MDPSKRLSSRGLYTVGWIAALSLELTAAIVMLDEEHKPPEDFRQGPRDNNVYVWGEIAGHNIVVAFLESGVYGTTSAATTASNLLSACPNVKFGLMVGIGAGIPQPQNKPDIRLGDVVVSQPDGQTGGVFQYDLIKAKSGGEIEAKGFLNKPPGFLLKSLTLLKARHGRKRKDLQQHLSQISEDMAEPPDGEPGFVYQGFPNDRLFSSAYMHTSGLNCSECDPEQEIKREERKQPGPRFHYGVIASGNTLVKDSSIRDEIFRHGSGRCLCLEMEAAGLMNNFPCLVIRGICDYADSHKNDKWQPYAAATAAAYARELLQSVPRVDIERAEKATQLMQEISMTVKEVRDTTNDTNNRMKQGEVTKWLSPPDPSTNFIKAASQRQTHTGQWFFDTSELSSWRADHSSFLWLYGRPGCGKTILSSTIIEHLSSETASSPSHTVLYYYFDFNDASKQSLDGLLRSLIIQLGEKEDIAWRKLNKRYDARCGSSQPSDAWLVETLDQMACLLDRVIIVVDTLDEVAGQGKRDELLRWIKNIIRGPSGNVRLIVTSRREQDIETALCDLNATTVDISRDAVNHDIMAYIRSSIRDDEKYPELVRRWGRRPDVRMEIEKALGEKADGMFRWAACQLDAIRDCYDLPSLRETLQSLPTTLDETYERIINGMSERQRNSAVKLLQLLTFAERPLRICEAVDAYAVNPSQNPAFLTENRMPNPLEIVRVCASLVTFGEKGSLEALSPTETSLQLAHFSVKEYMTSNRLRPQHLQVLFERVKAHASIVEISLGYMMSTLAESTLGEGTTLVAKAHLGYPFLKYASTHWTLHAKVGEQEEEASQIIDRFFRHPTAYRIWACDFQQYNWPFDFVDVFRNPDYDHDDRGSVRCGHGSHDSRLSGVDEPQRWILYPLQICIYFGLRASALRQIKHSAVFWPEHVPRGLNGNLILPDSPFLYLDSTEIRITTALYLSAEFGEEAIVNALLAQGVSATEEGGRRGTALDIACAKYEERVVKLLLTHAGEQVDKYSMYIRNALQKSLPGIYQQVSSLVKGTNWKDRTFRLLLARCSKLEDDDPCFGTVLEGAFLLTDDNIARQMIRKGANFDGIVGSIPWLSHYDSILAFIIRVLAQEQMEASFFDTMQRVHKDNTSLLYKRHASILYYSLVLGSTSLISLSGASEDPIARLNSDLYREKVAPASFINTKDEEGRTALHFHAKFGNLDVVKLLLRSGADVTARDLDDKTPLHYASINTEHVEDMIILHSHAKFGNLDVVRLLLRSGADATARDLGGMTPLHYAVVNGNMKVEKILIKYGADLGSQNNIGETPYTAASQRKLYSVFEIPTSFTDTMKWIEAEYPSYATPW